MKLLHPISLALALASLFVSPAPAAVKPEGPTTPELLAAMNRLSDAGIIEGRRGSLTFFRWSSAKPPALVRLGLWGGKIDNQLLALTATMPALEGEDRHRNRKPNAALNLALTRNVLLAIIPFEEGQPLAHFFELYHRHPCQALHLILKARPVL